jgi:glyoxylase-like metal-dependent hydrolase (beta-lactamase superfamily II)
MAWYRFQSPAPGVTAGEEPAVNPWFRANFYTITGRDAVLQFDFGCGLMPLRPALALPGGKPVIAVASHAHVDHIGAFHEFADRRGHGAEAAGFATMDDCFTLADAMRDGRTGPAVEGFMGAAFSLEDWRIPPAPLTATLAEGDVIDLGDRRFTVLHLPGHSPGGIGLFDAAAGLLLPGDAAYDDELLDDIPGASVPDYIATMQRLARFDCRLVLPGHGAPFGGATLQRIARDYLRAKGAL